MCSDLPDDDLPSLVGRSSERDGNSSMYQRFGRYVGGALRIGTWVYVVAYSAVIVFVFSVILKKKT